MKTVSVNGLVLRTRKYSEADHLLTIFTPELGKISAIAKGARKAKGGMRGKTQPFVFGRYLIFKGQSLYVVTEAEIVSSFNRLSGDVEKYAQASYLCELTDAFLELDYPIIELFSLLLSSLHFLNAEDEPLLIPWYQLQLLDILGYTPDLENCAICGINTLKCSVFSHQNIGGVACQSCTPNGIRLTEGVRKAMGQLLQMDILKISRIKLTESLSRELQQHLDRLIEFNLNKPLKSTNFLRCIKKD